MKTLIKGGKIIDNGYLVSKDILVEDKIIKKIESNYTGEYDQVVEVYDKLITPGFIDVHVHLREPGYEHKETIRTGTLAAARGGYTTICAMPNTNPVPDSKEKIDNIYRNISQNANIKVLLYSSISKGLEREEVVNMEEMNKAKAFAFTDDGVGIQSNGMMHAAMKKAKELEMSIVAHTEDDTLTNNGCVHEGEYSKKYGFRGIPSICESSVVASDLVLAKDTGVHYHVCHISTKETVELIRMGKQNGINVTCEVTPHHLLLTDMDIKSQSANYKMNPPLRSKDDKEALVKGLLDGTIDMIVTDHAPHTEEEKQKGLKSAPFGIVGLETTFPLLYTHFVKEEIISLEMLVDLMSNKPAEIFNILGGKIEEGSIADITIIDLEKEKEIDKYNFYSKGKNTPFQGWKCQGWPIMTICEGQIVYEDREA